MHVQVDERTALGNVLTPVAEAHTRSGAGEGERAQVVTHDRVLVGSALAVQLAEVRCACRLVVRRAYLHAFRLVLAFVLPQRSSRLLTGTQGKRD